MELNQLYYFRTVARTQNITAAAELLHISQPTLSKVIRRLEDDLGVRLFDRKASKLTLNPLGEAYLVYVDAALDALERGRLNIEKMKADGTEIRLASTFTGIPNMLVEQFIMMHPDQHVTEVNAGPDEISTLLLNDHVDLVMTLFPLQAMEYEQIAVLVEPMLLHIPNSLPPGEGLVRLADYKQEHFAIFEGGADSYAMILRCCNQANFVPFIVYRCTRSQRVHELVNKLNACTLMPAHLALHNWKNIPEETRRHILLIDEPKCHRTIYLYRKRRENTPEEVLSFSKFASSFFRGLNAEITTLLTSCYPEKDNIFPQQTET